MKYCLFLLIFFITSHLLKISSAEISIIIPGSGLNNLQEEPFYFNKTIPSKIKLLDRVDLSFFRNPLITAYRYRLEIPSGSQTAIDKKLIIWSLWTENDFADIVVPRLDMEGRYKLVIEYKTRGGSETKKLERLFTVFAVPSPVATPPASKSGSVPPEEKLKQTKVSAQEKSNTVVKSASDRKVTELSSVKTKVQVKKEFKSGKVAENQVIVPEKISREAIKRPNLLAENTDKDLLITNGEKVLNEKGAESQGIEIIPATGNIIRHDGNEDVVPVKDNLLDYEELLKDAIRGKDSALLYRSVQHGAGKTLRDENGGNLFHLLNDSIASERTISLAKNSGISINETDVYGNTPLHYAILTGKWNYARTLIQYGADLNLKNKLEFTPMHLAVLLNNKELVKDLLNKDADVNIKGKSGYTPLHLASELDYADLASILLKNGAEKSIKTEQGLSAKSIARIQDYHDIVKLIRDKGSYSGNIPASVSVSQKIIQGSVLINYPEIKFDLPFDARLAKKRQFNNAIQILSIPLFVVSTASAVYLRSEADRYYSLSKVAESEQIARTYYDKTRMFDRNSYITGSVSLISAFGFIHSSIRKKILSGRMQKSFY